MKQRLRLRIAATFALSTFLVVLFGTVGIFLMTDSQEEAFIEQILADEMESVRSAYAARGELQTPDNQILQAFVVRSPGERQGLPPDLRDLPTGSHEVLRDGKEFHVHVRDDRGSRFYLLYDASRHEDRIAEFKRFLLLAVLAAAAVSALAGYWLSGLLVRQVSDLARRVSHLDPAAGESRLAEAYEDEEVVTLASAFDRYHDRVAEIVKREKQFTSNVSHELRTPLTAIKTSCELLAQDAAIAGRSRERLEGVANAADRMTEITQALLVLAREALLDGDREAVNLHEAAEEAVAPFREGLAGRQIEVEVRVPTDAIVRVHGPALHLALSNLVRNAARYTDHGRIVIGYDRGALSVADTGCGIEPGDLPHIFDRFYRGEARHGRRDGIGLGLAIVKHIADRFGWKVSVESRPGAGSTFSIELPPASQFLHT